MKWYVVNVYSGFEQRVLESIYDAAKKRDLSSMFGEILIPTEEVVEIKALVYLAILLGNIVPTGPRYNFSARPIEEPL